MVVLNHATPLTRACRSRPQVWTPINNKFFETFSYLPPLGDDEIAKQVDYIVNNGEPAARCRACLILSAVRRRDHKLVSGSP